MYFKGNVIITDPCNIITKNNWKKYNYELEIEKLEINTYLISDNHCDDWYCITWNEDLEPIGHFSINSGLISVFLLDEVLKYNPTFNNHIQEPWTTTLIENFDGEISIKYDTLRNINKYHHKWLINKIQSLETNDEDYIDKNDSYLDDLSIYVIGEGNVNFITTQIGI